MTTLGIVRVTAKAVNENDRVILVVAVARNSDQLRHGSSLMTTSKSSLSAIPTTSVAVGAGHAKYEFP
jgi:galactokinase